MSTKEIVTRCVLSVQIGFLCGLGLLAWSLLGAMVVGDKTLPRDMVGQMLRGNWLSAGMSGAFVGAMWAYVTLSPCKRMEAR